MQTLTTNIFVSVWNKMQKDLPKWNKLRLSFLSRISVITSKVLPKMLFLFQTLPILVTDISLKQWQKAISKFTWQRPTKKMEYELLQDAKERGGFE